MKEDLELDLPSTEIDLALGPGSDFSFLRGPVINLTQSEGFEI